uniref:LisH domain-containing protein n=1 Tax=Heterorhabditis bacteriophora TaxID=37862 RepID=A0A1I7WX05_HETBA
MACNELLFLQSYSGLLPERKLLKLNPTILLFMQQHGKWSEEQITEDVLKKNYDSAIFATYELLCDKVGRRPTDDHPRRGSRGSILSGKANVEPEPLTPTISAHHLAQLNLSTSPECDSDDSSASDKERDLYTNYSKECIST